MADIITYSTLKQFVEKTVGRPLNTDMFWGTHEVVVYPLENRKAFFRVFHNLGRVSTRRKPHKKDNGNMLRMDMVHNIVHHYQTTQIFPQGKIRVIPG
jgi:hypothetical protein